MLFLLEDTCLFLFSSDTGIWGVCCPRLTEHPYRKPPSPAWVAGSRGHRPLGAGGRWFGSRREEKQLLVDKALGETTILLMEKIFFLSYWVKKNNRDRKLLSPHFCLMISWLARLLCIKHLHAASPWREKVLA